MRASKGLFASVITLAACHFPGTVVLVDDAAGDHADAIEATSDTVDVADTMDVPVVDVPDVADVVDVAPDAPTDFAPPRLIAPMSTNTVMRTTPTLRWLPAAGAAGTVVEICADRACTTVSQSFMSTTDHGAPTTALTPGVWFWRAHSLCGTAACPMVSRTWQFNVMHDASTVRADTAFGTYVDPNGDGAADLLVGAPQSLGGPHGTMTGKAYVFAGPDLTAITSVLTPNVMLDNFGSATSSAGDVNGDGLGDFLIGTPSGTGNVWVFFGASPIPSAPTTLLMGGSDGFGTSVAGIGDINRDGYGDIAIGAPGAASGSGAVYVLLGSMAGPVMATMTVIPAPVSGGAFGTSVASAGDVNGDGFADLIVGAPNVASTNGAAYVFAGSSTGIATTPTATLSDSALIGSFGTSVAGGSDVNADGFSDVVVGAPGWMAAGATVVFLGDGTAYVRTAMPIETRYMGFESTGAQFGARVAMGGDADGDGFGDYIVGAPNTPMSGMNLGRAVIEYSRSTGHMFSGSGLSLPSGFVGFTAHMGAGVMMADFNHDGLVDVGAGDPHVASGSSSAFAYHGAAGGIGAAFITVHPTAGASDDFGRILAWYPRRGSNAFLQ